MRTYLTAFVLGLISVAPALGETILVEAEGFEKLGGWVIDQQYMDQMGSPVVLAHGLGEPVQDAATTVRFPKAGTYRVWVRTRDWAAPWNAPEAPGKFQLLVNGKPHQTTFGTEGDPWHWQDGGTVEVGEQATIALHDLTGFDGRCDAIVFTDDLDLAPPNETDALAAFRRRVLGLPDEPQHAGRYDLVVVGGGMAGTCAAISAARLGLDVALIQNRPRLGGNNSSDVRVHLGGNIRQLPYPALGGVVDELDSGGHGNAQPAKEYDDAKKLRVVQAEKNLHLFLNTHAKEVETENGRIVAVVAHNVRTGRRLRFTAHVFADCTGDGTIGYRAGADYRYGREGRDETGESLAPEKADRMTLGASVMWYSVETAEPSTFPECPWAVQFNRENYQRAISGDWNWETGFRVDQIEQIERIRDQGLRAVYGNWAYQKNSRGGQNRWANRKLSWVAHIAGKRESRRLLGDVILQEQDIVQRRPWPDASVTSTWTIDLHYPIQSDQFPGEEFRSRAEHVQIKPYAIPYRCFYSRNIDNLLMAGRDISVTHVALGTVRVMRTCGMMGEVVGMAASICKEHDAMPRDVYEKHLDELKALMTCGVGKPMPSHSALRPPEWLDSAGKNLASEAIVTVSTPNHQHGGPPSNINDGKTDLRDNGSRWLSTPKTPCWVELRWQKPQKIAAARVISGYNSDGKRIDSVLHGFVLQYHDGQEFRDLPGTSVKDNEAVDWNARFKPVTTDRLRLLVTATDSDVARIWEVEFYGRK